MATSIDRQRTMNMSVFGYLILFMMLGKAADETGIEAMDGQKDSFQTFYDSTMVTGDRLFYRGNYEEARRQFFDAFCTIPMLQPARIGMYNSMIQAGHISDAARIAENLNADFPSLVNRGRVAYTAGLRGKSEAVCAVAQMGDSAGVVYRWGIVGLSLNADFFAAARISREAMKKTGDSTFLVDFRHYRILAGSPPAHAAFHTSYFTFDNGYSYSGGMINMLSVQTGTLTDRFTIEGDDRRSFGRNYTTHYLVGHSVDSVTEKINRQSRYHYTVPATGFDSTRIVTSTIDTVSNPAGVDIHDTAIALRWPDIVQNDVHLAWIHRLTGTASVGAEGRFSRLINDPLELNIMAGVRGVHAAGPLSLRHRLNANWFRSKPVALQERIVVQEIPGSTAGSGQVDTVYINGFNNQEFDTLRWSYTDTFVSHERWRWQEEVFGAPVHFYSVQYSLGLDWQVGPLLLSADGSCFLISRNDAGYEPGLNVFGGVSGYYSAPNWELYAGMYRGEVHLLDQSASLNTLTSTLQYDFQAGAVFICNPQFRISYNIDYANLAPHFCLTNSLSLSFFLFADNNHTTVNRSLP